MKKKSSKKHWIFVKWDHVESRPLCEDYTPFKILTLVRITIKIKNKYVKIHSTNHLEIFCVKNRSKKHEILEKWDHFESQPLCKDYSPFKFLTLVRSKIKIKKKLVKILFTNHLELFCEKKLLQKTLNIRKVRRFWNRPLCKGYSPNIILTLGQKLKF